MQKSKFDGLFGCKKIYLDGREDVNIIASLFKEFIESEFHAQEQVTYYFNFLHKDFKYEIYVRRNDIVQRLPEVIQRFNQTSNLSMYVELSDRLECFAVKFYREE